MPAESSSSQEAFAKVAFNIMRFRADMEKVPCAKAYQIFFTPRSGSSWLTSVLSSTKVLGDPGEYFNPGFLLPNARAFNANTLARYIAMLKRRRARGGVFGFEITYFQMLKTFGSERNYHYHFGPNIPSFYLIRKDIVKQAISLWKLVDGKIGHSVQVKQADIAGADEALGYDPHEIRRWVLHIYQQELGFQGFFRQFGYAPTRLFYEDIMAAGATGTAAIIQAAIGIAGASTVPATSNHQKVGSRLNDEFALRFCAEETDFVKMMEEERRNFHDF